MHLLFLLPPPSSDDDDDDESPVYPRSLSNIKINQVEACRAGDVVPSRVPKMYTI